ncbi:hypothetical protein D3C71_2108130 [compost metagenome]
MVRAELLGIVHQQSLLRLVLSINRSINGFISKKRIHPFAGQGQFSMNFKQDVDNRKNGVYIYLKLKIINSKINDGGERE